MGIIGKRGTKPKPITEKEVTHILKESFMNPTNKKYEVENLYIYDWESDYLFFTKTGYAYECEIKVSRSDFFNDKKKEKKHLLLEGKDDIEKPRPNYFYYAVPEGLITEEDVPEYAGLIYVKFYTNEHTNGYCTEIKKAPKLQNEKQDIDKLNLIDKFYYNYICWKEKASVDYISEIRKLKNEIKGHIQNEIFLDERLGEEVCEKDEALLKIKNLEERLLKYEKDIIAD